MKDSDLLSAFIQNAIDGIITINERGIIQSFNPSASKLFGYIPDEVIGRNVSMLMPPPDSIQHDYYLERYKETGKKRIIGIGREVRGLRKDGSTFPLILGVSEVESHDGKFYVGFIHDLTQQKVMEERLRDYASHLEELVEIRTQSLNTTIKDLESAKEKLSSLLAREMELSKLKSRFVSMASHEFRTPLNTVQLSASLIGKYSEPFNSPEINKHVQKIKNSVASLTSILSDFLYLEKLEAGKVETHYSEIEIPAFCTEIIEEMQMLAKPGQTLEYKHDGIETAFTDANLLKNCIINLVTNSIKYSNEGIIDIASKRTSTIFEIRVRDRGIGIPEADQTSLFEAFFRAANTMNIPGTGLGLNIVARYVGLMNGRIEFSSEPGHTIFTLTFPQNDQNPDH